MKETLLAAVFAFIAIGSWYMNVAQHPSTIQFNQIKTDHVTKYPYQANIGRTTFVEQVL